MELIAYVMKRPVSCGGSTGGRRVIQAEQMGILYCCLVCEAHVLRSYQLSTCTPILGMKEARGEEGRDFRIVVDSFRSSVWRCCGV